MMALQPCSGARFVASSLIAAPSRFGTLDEFIPRFSDRQDSMMLTISGLQSRYCDRISRRSWLQIGGLALGGLALPDILRAEAQSGQRNHAKGVIMVLLPGGPTHLDTFDPKPDAPAEIRGEFRPVATNV